MDREHRGETTARQCESPVLLIVWNRPEETRRVLEAIRAAQPAQLFVAADGPRSEVDAKGTAEVRRLVQELVDWPCDLRTTYSTANLGCRDGVIHAIDWFFSHVEEGIILEDDCLASAEFFAFCDAMLKRYRSERRVMHVAGDNTARIRIEQDWSYCFVRYPHIWGWATWRRAWSLYDRDLSQWHAFRDTGQLSHLFPFADELATWVPIFDRLREEGQPDTWDWQWAATCMMLDALCVQPTVNLVSNIGFNDLATHTKKHSERSNSLTERIFPLTHPPVAYRHHDAERQLYLRTQDRMRARPKEALWTRVVRHAKESVMRTRLGPALRRSFRSTSRN